MLGTLGRLPKLLCSSRKGDVGLARDVYERSHVELGVEVGAKPRCGAGKKGRNRAKFFSSGRCCLADRELSLGQGQISELGCQIRRKGIFDFRPWG